MYPAIALAAGIEGVVVLEITIDAGGKVVDAKVLRSHPLLDRAAIDAVLQWQFAPTVVDGRAVAITLPVSVSFRR